MKNFLWGTESFNDTPIFVVLFVSRNKDNKDIEGFTERRMSFITHDAADADRLKERFYDFVSHGKKGELSRMYYSVNARDGAKIHKALLHFLFDNPDFNLCSINSKLAGIAAAKENAATKHWMFDFDIDSGEDVLLFYADIKAIDNEINITMHKTPHGYAVITDRGFDTRDLLKKWGADKVTLKRDDLLCVDWKTKE